MTQHSVAVAAKPSAAEPASKPVGNLEMWNRLEVTDPAHVKRFDRGNFKGTAVDPIYNLKRMTHELGPVGRLWGWRIIKDELITIGEGDAESWIHNCILEVWFIQPDGAERVIHEYGTTIAGRMVGRPGERRFMVDDEYTKKSKTDALSRAMMALGASADIWLGRFDGNKYVSPTLDDNAAAEGSGPNKEAPEGFKRPKTPVDMETPKIFAKADMLLEKLAAVGSEAELRQVQAELTSKFDGEVFWTLLVRTSKVKASDLTKAIKASAETLGVTVRPAANKDQKDPGEWQGEAEKSGDEAIKRELAATAAELAREVRGMVGGGSSRKARSPAARATRGRKRPEGK